jgi:hypothetical protein
MPEPSTPENPEPAEQPEVPLNRAARRNRSKAKADTPASFAGRPRHVGPQADPTRSGRAPRPNTKRSI